MNLCYIYTWCKYFDIHFKVTFDRREKQQLIIQILRSTIIQHLQRHLLQMTKKLLSLSEVGVRVRAENVRLHHPSKYWNQRLPLRASNQLFKKGIQKNLSLWIVTQDNKKYHLMQTLFILLHPTKLYKLVKKKIGSTISSKFLWWQ